MPPTLLRNKMKQAQSLIPRVPQLGSTIPSLTKTRGSCAIRNIKAVPLALPAVGNAQENLPYLAVAKPRALAKPLINQSKAHQPLEKRTIQPVTGITSKARLSAKLTPSANFAQCAPTADNMAASSTLRAGDKSLYGRRSMTPNMFGMRSSRVVSR